MLGGAMISMGRTLEKLGPKRQFTRVRGSRILRSSQAQSFYEGYCFWTVASSHAMLSPTYQRTLEYHREPRPVRLLHRRPTRRGHTRDAARRGWCPRRRRAREGSLRSHAPYSGRSATRGRRAVRVRPLLDRGSLAEPRLLTISGRYARAASCARGETARWSCTPSRKWEPRSSPQCWVINRRGGERMSTQPIQLDSRPQNSGERDRLVRTGRSSTRLARGGLAWRRGRHRNRSRADSRVHSPYRLRC